MRADYSGETAGYKASDGRRVGVADGDGRRQVAFNA